MLLLHPGETHGAVAAGARPDPRLDRLSTRFARSLQFWLAQWKQPRFLFAGVLHIVLFAGFLACRFVRSPWCGWGFPIISLTGFRAAWLISTTSLRITPQLWYSSAVVIAAIRRGIFKPARYAVPAKYGKDHTSEAILVLGLIALLIDFRERFRSQWKLPSGAKGQPAETLAPLTLAWLFRSVLLSIPRPSWQNLHLGSLSHP